MYYNTKASGARIRELRIAKNFTQDDLAEHMNVSRSFISLIESGKKGCSVDVLIVLSALFGVSIDYLVLGTITYGRPVWSQNSCGTSGILASRYSGIDWATGEIQGAAVTDVTNGNADVTNVIFKTGARSSKIESQRKLTVP